MIKKTIQTTKLIGLIISWDVIVVLGDMVKWMDLTDYMFYSFVWLNLYMVVTIIDVKKEGMGLIFSNIINALYDDTLNESTKLNRAKELLGMGADLVSFMSQKALKKEKELIGESVKEISEIPIHPLIWS